MVEYWQWEKEEKTPEGKTIRVKLDSPSVFYAHVFNVCQMEGVPERESPVLRWPADVMAERILSQSGARIFHDQRDRAFYSPSTDEIHLPPRFAFADAANYYATGIHELCHWSGNSTRLNRDLTNTFGTAEYSREELRVELASYFISSTLGIPHDPSQSASYISSWIDALRKDHNELFRAAKDADHICDYVLQFAQELQQEQVAEAELEC